MKPSLFIASFGYKRIISHILEHYGVRECVTEIITPATVGCAEGISLKNKNCMIEYGLKRYNLKKGMLIDHWAEHVQAAISAGHSGYFVDYHQGLTPIDVQQIMMKIENVDALFLSSDVTVFQEHVVSQYIFDVHQSEQQPLPEPTTKITKGAKHLFTKI